jgi:hypothetical protein
MVTAAALPLSRTSNILVDNYESLQKELPEEVTHLASLTSEPLTGMGALIFKYCSPWRSLAYRTYR